MMSSSGRDLERSASLPARLGAIPGVEEDDDLFISAPRQRLVRSSSFCCGSSKRSNTFPPNQIPRVRLQPIRSQGRIVLQEVKPANHMQMSLRSVRTQGRLVLNLIRHSDAAAAAPDCSDLDSKKNNNNTTVMAPPPPPAVVAVPVLVLPPAASPAPPAPEQQVCEPAPAPAPAPPSQELELAGAKESSNAASTKDKFRQDHAHMLQELMAEAAAYASRRARLFPCKRDEEHHIWEQHHYHHFVTTSS